jgi:hypothetical protein
MKASTKSLGGSTAAARERAYAGRGEGRRLDSPRPTKKGVSVKCTSNVARPAQVTPSSLNRNSGESL